MLKINNLHASVEDKEILKGINLERLNQVKFTLLWGLMVQEKVHFLQ